MPGRRRAKLWIAGILGVLVVAALSWGMFSRARHPRPASIVYDERTPFPALSQGLRQGDARALLILFPRLAARTSASTRGATDAEAKELVEILKSMRTGYMLDRFGSYGRVSSMMMVTKILERLAIEPAPSSWFEVLRPVHDLFASGLADTDIQTRIAALNEVGRFWNWFPGRGMMPVEQETLIGWKSALYEPVLRHLGDREPQSRAAAIACLGLLTDDEAAARALSCLEDRRGDAGLVRKQVLASFAQRPALLTEDMLLKRLRDPEPGIPEMAELILSTRGLSREQIDLGRLIFDPKPEHRASVIPRLRNRSDIDPVVWLLQLSNDENAQVRGDAAAALSERPTPEVIQRLREMARSDSSPTVRQVAARFVSPDPKSVQETATALPLPLPRPQTLRPGVSLPVNPDATAALPPLPGSPSLNPKAN